MTQCDDHPAVTPAPGTRRNRLGHAISTRLQGPGGLYNAGNLMALAASMTAQMSAASDDANRSAAAMIREYFIGSPGASWLTLAVVIFFVSGEVYHHAWRTPKHPDVRLTRIGDLLAGAAAAALAFSLVSYGNVVLALVSGALLAASKFGSALAPLPQRHTQGCLCRGFRATALASRVPALAALLSDLTVSLLIGRPPLSEPVLMPLCMIACTLIWCRADYLLLRRS